MRRASRHYIMPFLGFIFLGVNGIHADASDIPDQESTSSEAPVYIPQPAAPFTSFTGRITKNKVRMRLQPSLDSPIMREANKGELVIVKGEQDDFFVIQIPSDTKAYVFRTFILDNVVEGNHVNVRFEPDLNAPVIAQLNAGEKVHGEVSPLNSKWLEIVPPESAHFYIAKEFVENIGDASMMAKLERRQEEVNLLLNSTASQLRNEVQKPFEQINLDEIIADLNRINKEYSDFPDQVARAQELITMAQDNYTQKRIAFLEEKAKTAEALQAKNSQLSAEIQNQQIRLAQTSNKKNNDKPTPTISTKPEAKTVEAKTTEVKTKNVENIVNTKMTAWIPVEENLYLAWEKQNQNVTKNEFYQNQEQTTLKGIIEPYNRNVKNKPGDYILLNPSSQLPIAYLYSTQINLQEKVGQEVTIKALHRPNNNFAFPAYFVLTIE